jgi:transcription termination factor Rho
MSELQLERSVLEAKERDELFAIADALGTRPGSRTKKADLVTQILRATGIEEQGAPVPTPAERPARPRTRVRKASASTAASPALPLEASNGEASEGSAAPASDSVTLTAANGVTSGSPASASSTVAVDADGAGAPAADNGTTGNGGPTTRNGSGRMIRSAARGRTADAAPPDAADDAGQPSTPTSSDPSASTLPTVAASVDGGPVDGGPANGASANGATVGGPVSTNGTAATSETSGRPDAQPRSEVQGRDGQERPSRQDRQERQERQDGGQGGRDRQNNNRPQPGNQASNSFDANESGNRRSRRRRGRDRTGSERQGGGGGGGGGQQGDRDLQGQGQSGEGQYNGEAVPVSGYLDLRDEGYGFVRTNGFLPTPGDVYVSISQARRYALRKGDHIEGAYRPAGSNEKYPALVRVDQVSGMSADDARNRPKFDSLTPLFPDEKLRLEIPGDTANVTARIVDLISPIGKGQRGLIVSPPKAGKTTVLKQIAHSIEANNPSVHLIVLLVDERPEEVTDMRRSVRGEVIASTFDRPSDEHTKVAEMAIERAKRLVEVGRDVVIVLDGITRLARAYNLAQPATGRIMSGGIDTGALYPPKKFFGSARNIEEGGSLTILATALVETGSRMDEVIFEEFKGTGNMELRLDRKLAERRVYPAIDVNGSSTRHEELLFDRTQLQQVWKLRRVLNALAGDGSGAAGLELLVDKIKTTRSNDQFLAEIAKTPAPNI